LNPEERPIVLVDCTKQCRERPAEAWGFLLSNIKEIAIFEQHSVVNHYDRVVVAIKPELLKEKSLEFAVLERME